MSLDAVLLWWLYCNTSVNILLRLLVLGQSAHKPTEQFYHPSMKQAKILYGTNIWDRQMTGPFANCLIHDWLLLCGAMYPDNDKIWFIFSFLENISVHPNNEICITVHGLSNLLPARFEFSLIISTIKNHLSIQYFLMLKDFISEKSEVKIFS